MAQLAPFPKFQATDDLGAPLAGGKLYTYQAGPGDTPFLATFKDATGSSANSNPVILDQAGRADVWLQEAKSYKFVLDDALDQRVWTVDGIVGIGGGTVQELSQFVPSNTTPIFRDATSFDVSGDQRGEFHVGRRVKILDGGGTLLGTIQSSTFNSTITTVTVGLDSGTIDSGISSVAYGFIRADEISIDAAAIKNLPTQTDPFPVGFGAFKLDTNVPPKWLEAGTEVAKASYPDLYALLGDTFDYLAGDPVNNFVVGDVNARSPVGRGSGSATRGTTFPSALPAAPPVGDAVPGGEGSHIPTQAETAPHQHTGGLHDHDMANHNHNMLHTHLMGNHTHSLQNHTHSIAHDHGIRSNTASNTTTGGNSNRWQDFGSVSNRTEGASPSTSGGPSVATTGAPSDNNTGNSPTVTAGPSEVSTGNAGAVATTLVGGGSPFNIYGPVFPVMWIIKALP